MIYPLYAEQNIALPDTTQARIFSFAYMVWGIDKDNPDAGCGWILRCGVTDGDNQTETADKLMTAIKELYPECQGYLRHRVETFPLSQAWLSLHS